VIPEEKRAAVERGLRQAFGAAGFEEIRRLERGLSSDLLFRVAVRGRPYVLRILTRIDEYNDPRRHFACMQAAAEAGIAPRVWHADVEEGVAITDFVEAVPLPVAEARVRLPRLLRRLHALPRFSKAFNYTTAHKMFIWRFRDSELAPRRELDEAFSHYDRLIAIYPRLDADMVSCHEDLKPENILFDGDRLWLVDWQAAFVNDRYFDLAVAANFVAPGADEERAYLVEYFGRPAEEYQAARFFLMQQIVHMFSAAVFSLLGAGGSGEATPPFREFHERLWAGVDLADKGMRATYGRVHWARLLENLRGARFERALEIVAVRGGEPLIAARL
jgi:aminoglycoside phosphotransferase (APT) family kinase protein